MVDVARPRVEDSAGSWELMPALRPPSIAAPFGYSSRLSFCSGPFHDGISDVIVDSSPDRPGIADLIPDISPSMIDRPALRSRPPRLPIARRIMPGSRCHKPAPPASHGGTTTGTTRAA